MRFDLFNFVSFCIIQYNQVKMYTAEILSKQHICFGERKASDADL